MKVFYESKLAKWLLWQGYNTITLGCFVFTKKSKEEMKQSTLNHEAIHVRQWEECMIASAVLLTVIMLFTDRKSTRLNSSHWNKSRMPSSA